jgi:Spy/CpxP family protein refolding chaperone
MIGMGMLSSVALAQPGGPGGPGGGGRFGFGGPMMLMRSEQIQKELEIVDDQLEELEAIGEDMRDSFQGLRDMSQEERETKMREIAQEYEKRVNEVLLPHQQKRLKQITVQFSSRGREGIAGSLTDGDLAKELKITDEQKEKLRKAGEEARTEMEEKMRKFRSEMEEKILAVLTDEQRRQYKEMIGEPFELDMRQAFQGRGGRGGGDDNRGGGGNRNRNDF